MRAAVALVAAVAALSALARAAPPAEPHKTAVLLQVFEWPASSHGASGFSGFELDASGTRFVAVTDRGVRVDGTFRRDRGGRIAALIPSRRQTLAGPDGAPLSGPMADAEGLAAGAEGVFFVSFERDHRVWRYSAQGAATPMPPLPGAETMGDNSGPEALAIDAAGRLYTLPEGGILPGGPLPLWRLDADGWQRVGAFPRHGLFRPVGADFGPDGHLFVLERSFAGLGFRSRVRRLAPDGTADTIVLPATWPGRFDNLEGIAVWRDETGALRLTTISDDNANRVQRTEIAEFRIPLAAKDAGG